MEEMVWAQMIDSTKRACTKGSRFLHYTILEQLKDRVIFSPKYNSKVKGIVEAPDTRMLSSDRVIINDLS